MFSEHADAGHLLREKSKMKKLQSQSLTIRRIQTIPHIGLRAVTAYLLRIRLVKGRIARNGKKPY